MKLKRFGQKIRHEKKLDVIRRSETIEAPSTAFSLFDFPWEIRRAIWDALLGYQTIHISFDAFVDHQSRVGRIFATRPQDKTTGLYKPIKGSFSHVVCHSTVSSEEAYQYSKDHVFDEVSGSEAYGDVRWARYRHRDCYAATEYVGQGGRYQERHNSTAGINTTHTTTSDNFTKRMCANILQTCHQVYDETFTVLYSTNTWSFKDPLALSQFTHRLSPSQIPLIATLHLDLDRPFAFKGFTWNNDWLKSLHNIAFPFYTSLTTLHIDILGILWNPDPQAHDPAWWADDESDWLLFSAMLDLCFLNELRRLRLESVSVICVQMENLGGAGSREHVLNLEERVQMANGISRTLMKPPYVQRVRL